LKKEEKQDFNEILLKEKIKQSIRIKEQEKNKKNLLLNNEKESRKEDAQMNTDLLRKKRFFEKENDKIFLEDENIIQNKINLEKHDILLNENKKIDEINKIRKENIDAKIQELFELFKIGDNEKFKIKYSEFEIFTKTKENFYEKSNNLKFNINKNTKKDNNSDSENHSENREEDIDLEKTKLNRVSFEDNSDARFAYDKNRDFLNSEINLRLKSDLHLMSQFNNFEHGLNMNKNLIDYSNTLHKDTYDKDNKIGLNPKQQKELKSKNK